MKLITTTALLLLSCAGLTQEATALRSLDYSASIGAPALPHTLSHQLLNSPLSTDPAQASQQGKRTLTLARPLDEPRYDKDSGLFVSADGARIYAQDYIKTRDFSGSMLSESELAELDALVQRAANLTAPEHRRLEDLYERGVLVPVVVPSPPPTPTPPARPVIAAGNVCDNGRELPVHCSYLTDKNILEECRCD